MSAARAEGAVAVGLPQDVAKDGVASFIQVGAKTTADAKSEALLGCKTKTSASKTSQALCKVVATFRNQCAAEALDPKDGTPGFGWAIADTEEEAKQLALANCRDTAGPDRQDACIIPSSGSFCDGKTRPANDLGIVGSGHWGCGFRFANLPKGRNGSVWGMATADDARAAAIKLCQRTQKGCYIVSCRNHVDTAKDAYKIWPLGTKDKVDCFGSGC